MEEERPVDRYKLPITGMSLFYVKKIHNYVQLMHVYG
jgi:hypothetical protein